LKDPARAEEYYDQAIAIARELQLKYYLCSYLHSKADLKFSQNDLPGTESLAGEALAIAREINVPDIAFRCRVLQSDILGSKDKPQARRLLEGMLREFTGDFQRAELHHSLYRMTGDAGHRDQALRLFRELYRSTPKAEYRERISEMEE
jgi:tetratricopeptide (TPR) repeat protein